MRLLKKTVFACIALLAFPPVSAADASDPAIPPGAMSEKVLGDTNAEITIIEYASLTCPHCAQFHEEILPKIKAEYIETGKAKLVYRDFPLDQTALKASLLARCAPDEQFFTFIDALFSQQPMWAKSEDPDEALANLGMLGGVSREKFAACASNEELTDYVLQVRLDGQNEFAVDSTPTVIVNGKKLAHVSSFEEVKAAVEPLVQ
ncbi:MAG: DsbA family protein [Alphaproteobacteria bacterium]